MPVYINTTPLTANSVGSTPSSIYLGTTRLWPTAPEKIGIRSSNSTASTLTVDYPVGSQSGDLIVMHFNSGRTATGAYTHTLGGPSWTQIVVGNHTAASGLFYGVYWAIRGSESSFTISSSTGTGFRGIMAEVVAYKSGTFNVSTPIGNSSIFSAAGDGNPTSTAINTTMAYTDVLGFYYGWRSGSTAWTVTWSGSSGLEEISDAVYTVSGYIINLSTASIVKDSPGSSGTSTVTASSGVTLAIRGVAMVAVQPL